MSIFGMSISKKLACNLIVLPEVPKSGLGGGLKAYPWMGGGGGAGGVSTATGKRLLSRREDTSLSSAGQGTAGAPLPSVSLGSLWYVHSPLVHVHMVPRQAPPIQVNLIKETPRLPGSGDVPAVCPRLSRLGVCDTGPCPPFTHCPLACPLLALPRSWGCCISFNSSLHLLLGPHRHSASAPTLTLHRQGQLLPRPPSSFHLIYPQPALPTHPPPPRPGTPFRPVQGSTSPLGGV